MNISRLAKETYNTIALSYHQMRTVNRTSGWFYNEYLEMPTTLKMLGNTKGKKVLDLGCGTGLYTRILKRMGAKVKAIDISKNMVEIARKEVPNAEFKVGSATKLPYKNEFFDIVVSPLMIEYLSILQWNKALKEVHRVLKKGGYFIFSTGNPIVETLRKIRYRKRIFREISDYFGEGQRISKWIFPDGSTTTLRYHHKTYTTIIRSIIKNKFEIVDYEDAKPVKSAKKYFPKEYKKYSSKPFFCTWKIKKKS